MRKLKKAAACLLAAAAAASISLPSLAAEYFGPEGQGVPGHELTEEQKQNGHTTFSIIEAKENPNSISFSVPLYVTMAVTKDSPDVVVPDPGSYSIVNTSKSSGITPAGSSPFDIAVVQMKFSKLNGSTYNTVAGPAVTGENDILFRIGKVTMPALNTAETADVGLRVAGSQFLEDSSAAGAADSNWKKIAAEPGDPANTLKLDLAGTVKADPNLADKAAAAQFRVQYTVSALDDNGKPLGRVYAGDDRTAAGLTETAP